MDIYSWVNTIIRWFKSIMVRTEKRDTPQTLLEVTVSDTIDKELEHINRQLDERAEALTLGQKQRKFSLMVAKLIIFAYDHGYEITLGDAWARDGHMKDSLHYKRLAIDLNLFKDGVYLTKTEDHKDLGTYWESLGGSWGGRFNDGNHYSLSHGGYQ